jgi:signal peptidase I, archaeal type
VTTHRVVEVTERNGQRVFITKGDANEDPDRAPVPPDAVIGVVPQVFGAYLAVPFVGRALLFAQSDQGIIALVFVPAGLLIVSEVWDLYRHATSGASEDETVADGSGDEDVAESERDDSAAGSGSDEVFDVAAAGDPAEAADGTAAAGSAANGTVPDDTGPESESEEVTDQ